MMTQDVVTVDSRCDGRFWSGGGWVWRPKYH